MTAPLSRRKALLVPLVMLQAATSAQAAPGAEDPDVIVVGSGAAGLAAALSAAEAGARVTVLEKMAVVGGNTLVCSGFYNAPDPERQKRQGIEDSTQLFFDQTYNSGHRLANPALVRILTREALPVMHWLEGYGATFKPRVFQAYGGLWPRAHFPAISHGRGYIEALALACAKKGIPVRTRHEVVGLVKERGRVAGVVVRDGRGTREMRAKKGVVIAAGGFSANHALCASLDPRLKGMSFTGKPSATGELLSIAEKAGAKLVDMREIQCNLGPPQGLARRTTFHLDVTHYILVNNEGKRFVAEDGARDVIRDAVLAQPGQTVFSVIDRKGFQKMGSLFQVVSTEAKHEGSAFEARTVAELAAKMGVPPEALAASVDEYNRAVATKRDPHGREHWMLANKIDEPPFYAARVRMAVHYTMGGIAINENAAALDRSGRPIPGLFAAGEATGGIHGANRVGGNGIVDAFVFGRIAGRSAAGSAAP